MNDGILLRPAEPERDFKQLAAWFSQLEDTALSEQGLREYFEKRRGKLLHMVAETASGELAGFHWAYLGNDGLCFLDVFVKPEMRRRGIGARLFTSAEKAAMERGAKTIQVSVKEPDQASRIFAEQRGFAMKKISIPMRLDLEKYDDRPYDGIITRLEKEGFRFTSMEELGDGLEDRRRLYTLNDSASMDTPGVDGEHPWASFEDFNDKVCGSDWYRPAGQKVVIDTASGEWVAMSAISRFEDHAYNLFTGVDKRYRGRKLAQAVKTLALRYARHVLKVKEVRTSHNSYNDPMLAIDRKLGYIQMPATLTMRKSIG